MLPIRRNEQNWLPEIFNDFFDTNWMDRANATAPAINVLDNEKSYELELAAPGLTKDDFQLSLNAEGNLSINMEKKIENNSEKKHGHYLRREFSYTKYHQTLALPEDVDKEKIDAKVEHGVLHVNLPKVVKAEEAPANRMISVQ